MSTRKYSRAEKQTRIIEWAEKHGRLPKYSSNNTTEARYGRRLENYICSKSGSFDPKFRELIYTLFDRKVNNKSSHNKTLRMQELLEFAQKHNRTPSIANIEERALVSILSNYTRQNGPLYNKKIEQQVLDVDRCFRTVIPKRYRKCINTALLETEMKLKEENFK